MLRTMQPMMHANVTEGRYKMNNENQTIRHQFLAMACQYLFGVDARCNNFQQPGLVNMKAIPVCNTHRSR
ncbi:MAG: hypothetical protein QG660_1666 [Pseudomonadota bacterium]|nr:hypothetical protein [Pseudomonadota bacterium]